MGLQAIRNDKQNLKLITTRKTKFGVYRGKSGLWACFSCTKKPAVAPGPEFKYYQMMTHKETHKRLCNTSFTQQGSSLPCSCTKRPCPLASHANGVQYFQQHVQDQIQRSIPKVTEKRQCYLPPKILPLNSNSMVCQKWPKGA